MYALEKVLRCGFGSDHDVRAVLLAQRSCRCLSEGNILKTCKQVDMSRMIMNHCAVNRRKEDAQVEHSVRKTITAKYWYTV